LGDVMSLSCKNLGMAREFAKKYADRDETPWVIHRVITQQASYVNNGEAYAIADQYERMGSLYQKIEEVKPNKNPKGDPRGEPVYLTEEEKQIVAAVLHPDEIGRDYFPGSEAAKMSLRFKLLGMDVLSIDGKKKKELMP
jgi:hypothetical protein